MISRDADLFGFIVFFSWVGGQLDIQSGWIIVIIA